MIDIEEEFRKTASALRSNGSAAVISTAEARYDFVHLGEKIALAMVSAAEEQVTQAQNMLEQTKAFAQGLREQIVEKDRELAEMNDRLKSFGETVLNAHQKFNNLKGD